MPVGTFTAAEAMLLRRVVEAIRTTEPGARVILYGSRARGDAEPDSDWDFLVLLDGLVDRDRVDRVRDAIFDLEIVLDGCPVLSSIVRSTTEWASARYAAMPFRQNVEHDGITL